MLQREPTERRDSVIIINAMPAPALLPPPVSHLLLASVAVTWHLQSFAIVTGILLLKTPVFILCYCPYSGLNSALFDRTQWWETTKRVQ